MPRSALLGGTLNVNKSRNIVFGKKKKKLYLPLKNYAMILMALEYYSYLCSHCSQLEIVDLLKRKTD